MSRSATRRGRSTSASGVLVVARSTHREGDMFEFLSGYAVGVVLGIATHRVRIVRRALHVTLDLGVGVLERVHDFLASEESELLRRPSREPRRARAAA
jgi:hypothetical protein